MKVWLLVQKLWGGGLLSRPKKVNVANNKQINTEAKLHCFFFFLIMCKSTVEFTVYYVHVHIYKYFMYEVVYKSYENVFT